MNFSRLKPISGVYLTLKPENDIRYIIRPAAHSNSDLVEFGISIAEKLIDLI